MKGGRNGGSGNGPIRTHLILMQSFNASGPLGLWQRFILSEWLWFDALTCFKGSCSDWLQDIQRWTFGTDTAHLASLARFKWKQLLFIDVIHNRRDGAHKQSDIPRFGGFSLLWRDGNRPVLTCWVTLTVESTSARTEGVTCHRSRHDPSYRKTPADELSLRSKQ